MRALKWKKKRKAREKGKKKKRQAADRAVRKLALCGRLAVIGCHEPTRIAFSSVKKRTLSVLKKNVILESGPTHAPVRPFLAPAGSSGSGGLAAAATYVT